MNESFANKQQRHIAKSYAAVFADAGRMVTYRRGENSLELTAVPSRPLASAQSVAHAVTEHHGDEWLIRAADLSSEAIAPGSPDNRFEPQAGDEIIEVIDGVQITHECSPPSRGQPPWRWSDPGKTVRRIHTTQIDEGPPA